MRAVLNLLKMITRRKVFVNFALCGLLLLSLAACSGIDRRAGDPTPEKRTFKEKPFSTGEWIKGDTHARGEMALDLLRYETFQPLMGKNQGEIIKTLGEPDKKTMGKCCYVRSGEEVEVWLYKIETPGEAEDYAVQVFFSNDGKTVISFNRGAMDKKPAHFPMIG